MPDFPAPDTLPPVILPGGSSHKGSVFLSAAITHPRWRIGGYTYASAHRPPADWAGHLAPYLYEVSPESLTLGKFCQIDDGCIIGARAVVGGPIPPYSIVTGNPGRVLRARFHAASVARLQGIAWWDWPIDRVLAHEVAICGADLPALEAAAQSLPKVPNGS